MDESAARRPQQFMADLTQAMRSTAELARQETIDDSKAAATARVDQLRARTSDEADELRKDAEADAETMREQSNAQMAQIRVEVERRISVRREALERELHELAAGIDLEISTVQDRLTAFEREVSRFFDNLLEGSDPTEFATLASQVPDFPVFREPDREALAAQLRASADQANRAGRATQVEPEPVAVVETVAPQVLPDHWWMDSPATLAARMRGGHA